MWNWRAIIHPIGSRICGHPTVRPRGGLGEHLDLETPSSQTSRNGGDCRAVKETTQ
jgi:hypothetical protein